MGCLQPGVLQRAGAVPPFKIGRRDVVGAIQRAGAAPPLKIGRLGVVGAIQWAGVAPPFKWVRLGVVVATQRLAWFRPGLACLLLRWEQACGCACCAAACVFAWWDLAWCGYVRAQCCRQVCSLWVSGVIIWWTFVRHVEDSLYSNCKRLSLPGCPVSALRGDAAERGIPPEGVTVMPKRTGPAGVPSGQGHRGWPLAGYTYLPTYQLPSCMLCM